MSVQRALRAVSALAPDGRAVAVLEEDGVMSLRELATGRLLRRYAPPAGVYLTRLAFTADGTSLVGVGAAEVVKDDVRRKWTLYVWDLASGRLVRSFLLE